MCQAYLGDSEAVWVLGVMVKGRRICADLTDTIALLSQSWPITGGRNLAQEPSQRGLLLTG